jgi:hypothetical protein
MVKTESIHDVRDLPIGTLLKVKVGTMESCSAGPLYFEIFEILSHQPTLCETIVCYNEEHELNKKWPFVADPDYFEAEILDPKDLVLFSHYHAKSSRYIELLDETKI